MFLFPYHKTPVIQKAIQTFGFQEESPCSPVINRQAIAS